MSIISRFLIRFSCIKQGSDELGNEYYQSLRTNYLGKPKRLVIYANNDEPSNVPPLYHAWLHYLTDELPSKHTVQNYSWQTSYIPNLTGKKLNFPLISKPRLKVSSDYLEWKPKFKE